MPRPLFCIPDAVLSLMLAGAPVWAPGQDAPVFDYDLAGGTLSTTLIEIAAKSTTVVSFDPELLVLYTAPPVRGRFTVMQALMWAIQGTGLRIKLTGDGVLTVLADLLPDPMVAAPLAPALAASEAEVPLVILPPVVVVGSGWRNADGLSARRGWSATRTDTPLSDVPQAVSVLTQDALSLQGGRTSTEALLYVTGAGLAVASTQQSIGGLTVPGLQLRGLPATYALSGMRTQRSIFPADVSFLARIEVIKGPSGVIGGIADTGGAGRRDQPGSQASRGRTAPVNVPGTEFSGQRHTDV